MNQGFGIEAHGDREDRVYKNAARYLVLIDAGGPTLARLFDDQRREVAEFDAGSEEVAVMLQGLTSARGCEAPEWDRALRGHSPEERAAAEIYTLDI
jgi:hypothetical protein